MDFLSAVGLFIHVHRRQKKTKIVNNVICEILQNGKFHTSCATREVLESFTVLNSAFLSINFSILRQINRTVHGFENWSRCTHPSSGREKGEGKEESGWNGACCVRLPEMFEKAARTSLRASGHTRSSLWVTFLTSFSRPCTDPEKTLVRSQQNPFKHCISHVRNVSRASLTYERERQKYQSAKRVIDFSWSRVLNFAWVCVCEQFVAFACPVQRPS
jgi:hypothetical protein